MQPGSTGVPRRSFLAFSATAVAAVASAGVLAACGGSTASTGTASVSAATSAATSNATSPAASAATSAAGTAATTAAASSAAAAPGGTAQISVSVWPDVADLQINNGMIGAFKKINPSITVSPQQWVGNYYQKLKVDIAGGTVPDMVYFQGWEWQPYALNGQIRAIDSYVDRDKNQLPSDLYPDIDAYNRQLLYRGKHYGVPVDSGSMIMYYNKSLFDAAHVPYPSDSWTLQDFLNTVTAVQDGLTKAGSKAFAYQPNYNDEYSRNFPWWRMNGGMEFDQLGDPKTATFTNAAVAAVFQRELHDLATKGVAISQGALLSGGGSSAYYNYGIQNGLTAMKVEGPWFLPQMWGSQAVTKGGIPFDVVHMPKGSQGYSEFWQLEPITIWNTSKHPDECWEYLKFAASPDAQVFVAQGGRMTNTPSSITSVWKPIAVKQFNFQNADAFNFSDGATMVETGPVAQDQLEVNGGLAAARDAIVNGSKTAAQALAQANPMVQQVITSGSK
jgi:multiple sugar transport system substrate-binding protein